MADKKITELTAIDAVQPTDLIVVIDDPSGTPITKKATVNQLPGGSFDTAADYTLTGQWAFKRADAPATLAVRITDPLGNDLIRIGTTNYGAQGTIAFIGQEGNLNVAQRIALRHDGFLLSGWTQQSWSNSGSATGGIPDVGLYRVAAKTLRVHDGSGPVSLNDFSAAKGGGLVVGDIAANSPRPTADATHRGMIWSTWGVAGVADTCEMCMKKADDTYAWVTIVTAP